MFLEIAERCVYGALGTVGLIAGAALIAGASLAVAANPWIILSGAVFGLISPTKGGK